MTPVQLKRRLQRCNLLYLSQLSGVDVRTIRWIRNTNRVPGPMLIAQLAPWIRYATR